MDPEFLARLMRLLDVEGSDLAVAPLPGGVSNRSYRLTDAERSWAIRLPLGIGEEETLDPATENQLLGLIAAAGLTPEVAATDVDSGALITRYLSGAVPWTARQAREPENISRIAERLRLLHGLEARLPDFCPIRVAATYLDGVAGANAGLSGEEEGWGRELTALAAAYEERFSPTTLCHNDLVAANILERETLWLVDFEYALRSDPILDLASLAGMNNYDTSQRGLLLEAYDRLSPTPSRCAQLDDVIRLTRLLSYFWAVSRSRKLRDGDGSLAFAEAMAAMLR